MSRPHLRHGACYFYTLPLYEFSAPTSAHSSLDFLIDESESTLGIPVYGAFWNTRALYVARLGREIGHVTSDQLLVDLYLLRMGIDEHAPRHWRLGRDGLVTTAIAAAREREISRWNTLTAPAERNEAAHEQSEVPTR